MAKKLDLKMAVVAATFGSTNPYGRAMALDGLIDELGKRHPGIEIRRAYISSVVRQRVLASDGIGLKSPEEVLAELIVDGYTHVVIVTTELIPGTVYESMEELVKRFTDSFEKLVLAKLLLWNISEDRTRDDIYELLKAIDIPSPMAEKSKAATVCLCHGTKHPAQKYYSKLNDRLRSGEFSGVYMYCLEASPKIDELVELLHRDNVESIRLQPLMYTLGKHVLRDMAKDAEHLRSQGFKVIEVKESLSSNDKVISMIADRACEAYSLIMGNR